MARRPLASRDFETASWSSVPNAIASSTASTAGGRVVSSMKTTATPIASTSNIQPATSSTAPYTSFQKFLRALTTAHVSKNFTERDIASTLNIDSSEVKLQEVRREFANRTVMGFARTAKAHPHRHSPYVTTPTPKPLKSSGSTTNSISMGVAQMKVQASLGTISAPVANGKKTLDAMEVGTSTRRTAPLPRRVTRSVSRKQLEANAS